MPIRHSSTRHHSHSISLGAVNSSRVTRRKSMNASAVNGASIVAALQEDGQGTSNRRSWNVKSGNNRAVDPKRDPGSSRDKEFLGHNLKNDESFTGDVTNDESAISDDFLPADHAGSSSKTKARRASEGSYLTKEGKRSSGELRCEKCGKGYKHSSCLMKHLSVPPDLFVLQLLAPSLLHLATLVFLYTLRPTASVVNVDNESDTQLTMIL